MPSLFTCWWISLCVNDLRDSSLSQLQPYIILTRSSATAEIVHDAAIHGHSVSSVVVPIDTAYVTSYSTQK